jgi:glycosyltransferase involved in cell wall biosynthesis
MSNPRPFFSIIIPTYNRKDFLPIAVESVLKQTFSDYELIIVDDGSTDNTPKLLRSDLHKLRDAKYLRQPHRGISSARNLGIKKAQGKFIAFLDSDDRFCRKKLEITYEYIQSNPGHKIFHSEEVWYRNGKLLSQKAHHRKPEEFIFAQALKLCCVSLSTAAIDKEVFKKIGYFDKRLPACEDYDFFLRASVLYPVFLIPKHLTVKEGGHADQLSKKYPAMDKFRIYALEKILKAETLSGINRQLAYRELERKCNIYIKGALKRKKKVKTPYLSESLRKAAKQCLKS